MQIWHACASWLRTESLGESRVSAITPCTRLLPAGWWLSPNPPRPPLSSLKVSQEHISRATTTKSAPQRTRQALTARAPSDTAAASATRSVGPAPPGRRPDTGRGAETRGHMAQGKRRRAPREARAYPVRRLRDGGLPKPRPQLGSRCRGSCPSPGSKQFLNFGKFLQFSYEGKFYKEENLIIQT